LEDNAGLKAEQARHQHALEDLQQRLAAVDVLKAAIDSARTASQAAQLHHRDRLQQLALLHKDQHATTQQQAELDEQLARVIEQRRDQQTRLAAALTELGYALPEDRAQWIAE
ncbi:hypothetical protein, partial [Pseudomonas viridiflava]|uniref:hypothetical protein n=1 Tax=Pseudomonas viridiflava TaxID=33069 RepID=UPI0013CE4B33